MNVGYVVCVQMSVLACVATVQLCVFIPVSNICMFARENPLLMCGLVAAQSSKQSAYMYVLRQYTLVLFMYVCICMHAHLDLSCMGNCKYVCMHVCMYACMHAHVHLS
jgi:hypothetical protein